MRLLSKIFAFLFVLSAAGVVCAQVPTDANLGHLQSYETGVRLNAPLD